MLLLARNIHGKTSQKVKTDDILKACMCYLQFALMLQFCTRVTTLHLCYMKMHMFSANQKCAILLYALLCL